MTTLIEKDSPVTALLLLSVLFLFFVGGGLGLAYVGGVFTGKNEVTENDKGIADLSRPLPASSTAHEPVEP